jgi:uncharacterized protein YecE (DUF72 family)
MQLRSKSSRAVIVLPDDPASAYYVASLRELHEAWDAIVWVDTTNLELNARRREIAAWAREANAELMTAFGHGAGSEEVRVMLTEMASAVPKRPDENGQALLSRLAGDAHRLAHRATAAVAAVTVAPLPRSPY